MSVQGRNASELNRQAAAEERWAEDYRLFEADWDFRFARIRTIVRWIAPRRAVRGPRSGASSIGRPMNRARDGQGLFQVPIESIVGTIDTTGTKVSPLPPLRRRHLAAWRRRHIGAGSEPLPALAIREAEDGLYLIETADALVTIEVARAKGFRAVSVRPDSRGGCAMDYREADEEYPSAVGEHAACCGA